MSAYATFRTERAALYTSLGSARENIASAYDAMIAAGTTENIAAYESALDAAAAVRNQIGENGNAEVRRRASDCGL